MLALDWWALTVVWFGGPSGVSEQRAPRAAGYRIPYIMDSIAFLPKIYQLRPPSSPPAEAQRSLSRPSEARRTTSLLSVARVTHGSMTDQGTI